MMFRAHAQKIKRLKEKHQKHFLTIAFIFGFLIDNITLNRVDQIFDNIVLATYVVLAMGSMLLLYASFAEKFKEDINERIQKYAPLLSQYAFGGLFSGILIFYGKSGSLFASWPFILIILAVIVSNETIKDRAGKLIVSLAMLFVGLFSYVVLVVPVITGVMGSWIFVASSILALIIMSGYIKILRRIVPRFITIHLRMIIFTIGTIFALMQFLYFTNIIPPIPLSLKDIGIYHSVVTYENGDYRLTYEKPAWWQFWRESDKVFHAALGDNVFCFASVFAPARLSTDIYHKWEYYDETKGEWVQHGGRLSYAIAGGRGAGYRGYTLISNYTEGTWRCVVETARGQVLGSEKFRIEAGARSELITRVE